MEEVIEETTTVEEQVKYSFVVPVKFTNTGKPYSFGTENPDFNTGDYVVVEKQPTAENGDMVVALIEDGATVKTFYREEGVIRLQPENDAMEPFILEDVTILGKVVAVMRFFR